MECFRHKHPEKWCLSQCLSPWRYFPLLAKQRPGHPECDVLTNVFAVLSAKNLSGATASIVMDIVDDLLNLPDFEPTETVPSLPVTGCVYAEVADDTGVCAAQSGWLIDVSWSGKCLVSETCVIWHWLHGWERRWLLPRKFLGGPPGSVPLLHPDSSCCGTPTVPGLLGPKVFYEFII